MLKGNSDLVRKNRAKSSMTEVVLQLITHDDQRPILTVNFSGIFRM
jgi:hypothetical protein